MEGKEFSGPSPEDMGADSSLKKEEGTDMVHQEKTKSPEKLRFEELVADARVGLLKGSKDPEKMAVSKLVQATKDLEMLVISLNTLANWDEQQKEKGYLDRAKAFVKGQEGEWEEERVKRTAKLESTLSELGLAIPQTAEEARTLNDHILSLENMQKLAENLRTQEEAGK